MADTVQRLSKAFSSFLRNYLIYVIWAAVFAVIGARFLLAGWSWADATIAAGLGFTAVLVGGNAYFKGDAKPAVTGALFSALSLFTFFLYIHSYIQDVFSVFLYFCVAILLVTLAWLLVSAFRARKLASSGPSLQKIERIPGPVLKALGVKLTDKSAVVLVAAGMLLFYTCGLMAVDAYWADTALFSVLGMSILLFTVDIFYKPSVRTMLLGIALTCLTVGLLYVYTPIMDVRGIRYIAAFFYLFGSVVLAVNWAAAVARAGKLPVMPPGIPTPPVIPTPPPIPELSGPTALQAVNAADDAPYEDKYAATISNHLITTQQTIRGLQSEIQDERAKSLEAMQTSLRKLLKVLDSIELYLDNFKDKNVEGYGRVEYLRDMIVDDILTPAGVKKMEVLPGEAVNGIRCKLVDGEVAPKGFNGMPRVRKVVVAGYMMGKMVLRPAKVEADWEKAIVEVPQTVSKIDAANIKIK